MFLFVFCVVVIHDGKILTRVEFYFMYMYVRKDVLSFRNKLKYGDIAW